MPQFIEEVYNIFSKDGILSRTEGFEYRPQQQEMACQIAESFENSEHCLIEAPTGIGKSLAYLAPSLLFSVENKRKSIISTATINLQEQLIRKDIPLLKDILPIQFRTEILKGRQNYICSKRLSKAVARGNDLFDSAESELIQEIYSFVQKNDIGEKQYLPFPQNNEIWNKVWSEIFAEQGICTAKSCGTENSNCYYQQAKYRLKNANLIILNHYLFFTLFGYNEREEPGYLYLDDFMVFDEAHMVESIAANNVSPSVSREQLRFWLYKLYNPKNKKGYLNKLGAYSMIRTIPELINVTDLFFNDVETHILNKYRVLKNKKEIRVREKINIDKSYIESLKHLCNDVKALIQLAQNEEEKDEIDNYWDHFNAFKNTITNFLEIENPEFIYWIKVSDRPRGNTVFNTSPYDMADYFKNNIFTENRLSVMTSATLSVSKSMDYFKRTIGASEIKDFMYDSPFDYARQMKIILTKDTPVPKQNKGELGYESYNEMNLSYENVLTDKIKDYVLSTNGGALVLFTNIRLLKKIYQYLKPELSFNKIKLIAQGTGLPRNKLLEEFQSDVNSVLFGVDSFWMGVDVPGDSLRNLIITKLPFDVPDSPIVEAKIERIKLMGGNPFMDFTLPWAVIKFKQGAGRLIRNKTDNGILVILDSRVVNKFYGKFFINSLPECEIVIDD